MNYQNDIAVRDIIRKQVTEAQEPVALAALRNSKPLLFGALELISAGITKGAESLAWSEVESATLHKGILTIKQKNKRLEWATLRDVNIPNVHLLVALVAALWGQ